MMRTMPITVIAAEIITSRIERTRTNSFSIIYCILRIYDLLTLSKGGRLTLDKQLKMIQLPLFRTTLMEAAAKAAFSSD